jgi:molybdate transport system substrate-binding protein
MTNQSKRLSRFPLLLVLCLTLRALGCGSSANPPSPAPSGQRDLRIASSTDMRFALSELVEGFQQAHPDIKVQVDYAASGVHYSRLLKGAPCDLFLSSDIELPRGLSEAGVADKESIFQFAVGQIVIWAPNRLGIDVEASRIECLTDPRVTTIAIADPKQAPYGRAAEAVLESYHIAEQVRSKIVVCTNVAQAAEFAKDGRADVAIVALALAVSPLLKDDGDYWLIPPTRYPTIHQGGVILNNAQDRPAADAFRGYITSPAGREVLKLNGFQLPWE